MFGKPNSKGMGSNKLVIGTNVRNNKDLDIPISFGRSSKDYIIEKKKEKEKRIYERIKGNKMKIISYYVLQYNLFKLKKREFCNDLIYLISQNHKDINKMIQIFRFTLRISSNGIKQDIERFIMIIETICTNFEKVSIEISFSNLLFLFRNCLILIFLDDQKKILNIDKNLLKNLADQILYSFFSRSNSQDQKVPNKQINKKNFINMIFDFSMIDLFFIRYFELRILNKELENEIIIDIFNEAFQLCISKLSRKDTLNLYYMGKDFIDFPKNDNFLSEKSKKLTNYNNSQLEIFFKNRYFWIISCLFTTLFKTNNIITNIKTQELFQTYLGLLDLDSFQNWIMNESQNSIRVIKSPIQQIPPNSPFSLLLLNYSFFNYIQVYNNYCKLSKAMKLNEFKKMQEFDQKEFVNTIENNLLSIYYIINSWNFSPNTLTTIDETISKQNYTSRDEIIQMISFLFQVITQNNNPEINSDQSKFIKEKLKIMYLIRLFTLFLDLQGKFLLLSTYIKNTDIIKDKNIFFAINNHQLNENQQLFSKNTICQIIQPILNLALDCACRDETNLKHAINIINLMNDIYFPLNQVPNIIFENIYFYNNIFTKNKVTYLHNALDLSIDRSDHLIDDNYNRDHHQLMTKKNKRRNRINIFRDSGGGDDDDDHHHHHDKNNNICIFKKMRFFFLISDDHNNEDKLQIFHKSQDHEFLEKIYYNSYSNDYHNFQNFCNIMSNSKLEVFHELQNLVLNYLSFDTCWVLVLFLTIHNRIIFNNKGNMNSFLLDIIEGKDYMNIDNNDYYYNNNHIGKLLTLFGISLNHQLQFLDDYEVKKSLEIILLKNSSSNSNNSDYNNDNQITSLKLIPSFNSNEIMIIDNKVTSGMSGSEILDNLLEDLSKHKDLSMLVNYENIQSINKSQKNPLINPFLLINNRNQLNYISLFINN
ncbi:E3A like HECT domain containing ubiquitin protein ligase, partial [Cryptosporidium meleagridis]